MPNKQTIPTEASPMMTKSYTYLVFWWANHDAGFSNGSTSVPLINTRFTLSMYPEVLEFIRKHSGHANAEIMSFSEFAQEQES